MARNRLLLDMTRRFTPAGFCIVQLGNVHHCRAMSIRRPLFCLLVRPAPPLGSDHHPEASGPVVSRRLMTVPGIGPICANANRRSSTDLTAAYFRLDFLIEAHIAPMPIRGGN